MYPNLYYIFKYIFGIELPLLQSINSFGLLEALSFCAAAYVLTKELKRKEAAGAFQNEIAQSKQLPSDTVPFVTILAAITGIGGAKIFGFLENPAEFMSHPIKSIFSMNGFAFYGGLLIATAALWIYYSHKKMNPFKIADAVAPSLMPAYAIGRIGCQIAGDGDWGIVNVKPNPISWMPDWMWAYDYPHNISKVGTVLSNCDWDLYCYHLAAPVYPTPIYETILIFILFFLLWSMRKHIKTTCRMSAIYLVFISTERFFIEFIRINPRLHFLGMSLTQAQIISLILFACGVTLFWYAPKLKVNKIALE